MDLQKVDTPVMEETQLDTPVMGETQMETVETTETMKLVENETPSDAIHFTDDEVSRLNDLRRSVVDIFTQLGQIHIEIKHRLEDLERNQLELEKTYDDVKKKEDEFFKELNDKYGNGSYDPTTNTFIPDGSQSN